MGKISVLITQSNEYKQDFTFLHLKRKMNSLRKAASEMLSVKKPAMSTVCFHQAITHTTMLSLKVSPNMPLQGDDIQG